VSFGLRQSQREVDHNAFSYFGTFADNGCSAQWKAVDQFAGTPECNPDLPQGELVDGVFTNYTLLPPTRLDQHNKVVFMNDFGPVKGIPGVWVVDPREFDNTLAYQEKVFGAQ